jgi:hypothetical protein
MTVREDVETLVRGMAPHGICDDCITSKLGLTVRQHANHKTNELAHQPGFHRERDVCGVCRCTKLVIWHGQGLR